MSKVTAKVLLLCLCLLCPLIIIILRLLLLCLLFLLLILLFLLLPLFLLFLLLLPMLLLLAVMTIFFRQPSRGLLFLNRSLAPPLPAFLSRQPNVIQTPLNQTVTRPTDLQTDRPTKWIVESRARD